MGAPQADSATAGNVPLATGHEADTDLEWEYEYDENQTEDFHFTLDLPVERPSKRRKILSQQPRLTETPDTTLGLTPSRHISNGDTGQQSGKAEGNRELLLITGLETTIPAVEYRGQRFDCQWTTDLGTQFHVSHPGLTKDPYRKGHTVDVVVLSRVRLTGRPSTALPAPAQTSISNGASAGHAIVLDDDEDEVNASARSADLGSGQPQLSFLDRVAEIQRRKKKKRPTDDDLETSRAAKASETAPAMQSSPQV